MISSALLVEDALEYGHEMAARSSLVVSGRQRKCF